VKGLLSNQCVGSATIFSNSDATFQVIPHPDQSPVTGKIKLVDQVFNKYFLFTLKFSVVKILTSVLFLVFTYFSGIQALHYYKSKTIFC